MEDLQRKTFLIRPHDHAQAKCRACAQPIVWVFTERMAKAPMNSGFEIVESVSEGEITLLRVYCDQNHFATCKFAERFKGKRDKAA